MSNKVPVNKCQKDQCLLRYGWFSCYLCSRCSVWFPCMSTKLSALFLVASVRSFKNSFYLNHRTGSIHGSNTSVSLIILEYTEVFEWPHSQNSRELKSGGIMQASWLSLHIPSSVDPKSGSQAHDARKRKDFGIFRPWQWLTGVTATKNICQEI